MAARAKTPEPDANPVGALMVDTEQRAKKKTSGTHTGSLPCGCEVEVAWFSDTSRRVATKRCFLHEHKRPESPAVGSGRRR